MKIILLILAFGCDLLAVKSPEHIVQSRKEVILKNADQFKRCIKQSDAAIFVHFHCELTEKKSDQYWFPERFAYITPENSKCFTVDKANRLIQNEAECIQQKLLKLKFPIVVRSSKEPEYVETALKL